ncbi:hypothetical protein HDU86_006723 [Geranomyces michiganensis]|nr:hypothetical protein HDU86_006723 [Geranomyces michiganensis]
MASRSSSRRTSSLDGFRRMMEAPISVPHTVPSSEDESGTERIGSPDRPLTAERIVNNPPPGWGRSKARRVSPSRRSRDSSRLPGVAERVPTRGRSRSVARSRRTSRVESIASRVSDVSRSLRGRRAAADAIREETKGTAAKAARRGKTNVVAPKTPPGRPRIKPRAETRDIGAGWNASRKEKKVPGTQTFTSIMNESPADLSAMTPKRKPVRRRKPGVGPLAKAKAAVAAEKSEPPSGKITAVDYERTKQLIALLSGTTYEFVGLSEVSKAHIAAAGNKHETGGETKKKGAKDAAKAAEEKARLKKLERQAQHERRTTLRGTVVRAGSITREHREEKQHRAKPSAPSVTEEDSSTPAEPKAISLSVPEGGGHGPVKKGRGQKKTAAAAATGAGNLPPIDDAQDVPQPPTTMVIPLLVFEDDSDSEDHRVGGGRSSHGSRVTEHVSDEAPPPVKRATPRTSVTDSVAATPAIPPIIISGDGLPSATSSSSIPDAVVESLPEFAMPQQTWGTRPPRKPKPGANPPAPHQQPQVRLPQAPKAPSPKSSQPNTPPSKPQSQPLPRILARASSHGGMELPPQITRLLPPRPEGNIQYSYRTYLDSIMHPNILLPPFRMPPLKQVLYGPYERQLWEYFCGRIGWQEVQDIWASAHDWHEEEMAVEAM